MLRKTLSLVLLVVFISSCTPAGQINSASQEKMPVSAQAVSVADSPTPASQISNLKSDQPADLAPAAPQVAPAVRITQADTAVPTAATASAEAIAVPTKVSASTEVRTANVAPAVKTTQAAKAPNGASQSVLAAVGPDEFPEGINPLTGLPVGNSANLSLSPALVSITNFPVSARPQAGLSFSPFVFELYIGEGMTRYLALFYGDYPVKGGSTESGIALSDDRIGPIRSGRVPFESLRKSYNGFLVMASASPNVRASLSSYTNIFGSDTGDINSAMIPATKLEEIANNNDARVKPGALSGLRFDPAAPEGGQTANMLWIPFSFLNQVIWRYDTASGAFLRYQDQADGKTFKQATDRLNGQPLTYENVVILFANHEAKAETLINIDLDYINKMPALIYRDGKMYEVFWTTANGSFEKTTGLVRPIRFVDAQGNPFPLKPGQTWVEMVQSFTRYNETVDTNNYAQMKSNQAPGSGNWVIHFYPTVP